MALNVNNSPTAIFARDGISDASKALADVSRKFATGQKLAKPSENLFASIEAAMGSSTMVYTKSALANLTRLRAILSTRTGALETMRSGAQELANISLQASGALPADVRSANVNVFAQVMDRVGNIAKTADYGGISLLDGTFGSAGGFTRLIADSSSPSVRVADDYVTGNGRLLNVVNHSTIQMTFAANAHDGDTIAIAGKTFTFREGAASDEAGEIQIGADLAATIRNTMDTLARSDDADVKRYDYVMDIANSRIDVTTLASSDRDITDIVGTGRLGTANPVSNASAVAADAYRGGPILGEVKGLGTETRVSSNAGRATITNYMQAAGFIVTNNGGAGDVVFLGAAAHANDTLTKFTFTIGTEEYNAYHFTDMSNGGNFAAGANIQDTLYCIKASDDAGDLTGKVFRMRFTNHADLNFSGANQGNVNTFVTNFNTDAASFTFAGRDYMTTNSDVKEVLVAGESIGTLSGLTAQYLGTSFDGLKVSEFDIDSGKMILKMKNDKNEIKSFEYTLPANKIIQAGSNMELVATDNSGDKVILTLGGTKDLTLNTDDNRGEASKSIKRALGASDSSTFIVGTDVSQTLTLSLNDMSWTVLTNGTSLKIDSTENAQTATTILNTIVERLNAEIGITAAYDKAVDSLVQQMEVSQQNLSAAVEELTAIDIAETREQLDTALRVYNACIGAIMADNRAQQTLQKLVTDI